MGLPTKILIGRLLTRSGDQAWDFALPLVLLIVFPGQLRFAATYYFVVRLLHTMFLPRFSMLIDQWGRSKAVRFGIILQFGGVLLGTLSLYWFVDLRLEPEILTNAWAWGLGIVFILGGVMSSLGASFMDIAIANDLVPSSIPEGELTFFNSRLRQVDLLTEVLSPVLAGFILAIDSSSLIGFYILALWNLLSFFPELALIKSVFRERPDLKNKPVQVIDQNKISIVRKLLEGWRAFFNEPVALVCIANAFLWLSVLSPHGVLLTAFLKDSWNLPEWVIGIVRGSGAIFGLLATVIFPRVVKKIGVRSATLRMVFFQCATLILALILFIVDSHVVTRLGFLALLLLSRIGVYGFGLGETQIRQIEVRPSVRGQVNGFASALTGFATLILYGAGALLPSTSDFKYLVIASVGFICISSVTYGSWYKRNKNFTGGNN